MSTITSFDEVDYDLAGSAKAEAVLRRVASIPAGPEVGEALDRAYRKERGRSQRVARIQEPPPNGRSLIARCSGERQQRYRSLIRVEKVFPEDGDFGLLLVPGCQLLVYSSSGGAMSCATLHRKVPLGYHYYPPFASWFGQEALRGAQRESPAAGAVPPRGRASEHQSLAWL
jgi:hypothetical protein